MDMHWPKADFHVHATYYRAWDVRPDMKVADVVRRYEELGFSAVGVVEHLDSSPKHPFSCLRALVEEARGLSPRLSLFLGAEVDVREDGRLTCPSGLKEELGLDFLLVAVHGIGEMPDTVEEFVDIYHRALMAAAISEGDVVAHPWTWRPPLDEGEWGFGRIPEEYLKEFAEALADTGKAVEVSRKAVRDFPDPAYRKFLQGVLQAGVGVSVGSDAHDRKLLGTTDDVDRFLQEIGLKPDQLWSPQRK